MGKDSAIEWTHHTFNPVWGCIKVSPGCEHCYAEGMAHRFGNNIWGSAKTTQRRQFGAKHWQEPIRWNKTAGHVGQRHRVFCASMADVAEDHPDWVEPRAKLVKLIYDTPNLIWLLLTKRPQDFNRLFDAACYEALEHDAAYWLYLMGDRVWVGTSVEDQKRADERIPELFKIPAAIRWLSMEPLLGAVDLWAERYRDPQGGYGGAISNRGMDWINWVIVGGESGDQARPMSPRWARDLRDQCEAASVPFFFKQWGEWMPTPEPVPSKVAAGGATVAVPDSDNTTRLISITAWAKANARDFATLGEFRMYRAGKHLAGRLLDGITHNAYPQLEVA